MMLGRLWVQVQSGRPVAQFIVVPLCRLKHVVLNPQSTEAAKGRTRPLLSFSNMLPVMGQRPLFTSAKIPPGRRKTGTLLRH